MTIPTIADFKAYFVRDFPYGSDINTTVLDADITKAIGQAGFNFNEALFGTQTNFTIAYLYLTAHYLVVDLQASSQGISGQFAWLQASKAVGSVSEGFTIPQKILDNPLLALYSKTTYGAKYLSLIMPLLVGPIFSSRGRTHP